MYVCTFKYDFKEIFFTKQVTADVGKDGCVRTKHTRIMGACSIPEVRTVRVETCSGESSDECCYIEVDPTDAPHTPTVKTCLTQSPARKDDKADIGSSEGKEKNQRWCVVS